MNDEPVLIEDDDVDMEPVVIVDDDDKINNDSANDLSLVETIDLDDESPRNNVTENINNDVILINDKKEEEELPKTSEESSNKSEMSSKMSRKSFVNSLKNNKLMNNIVSKCLTMENAIGMPRVINKTLLPLYRDADNRFKESKQFRRLLKKTYKMLTNDPDHKFLHIKTLCEELKSGLRRKVPFVTLATNLKSKGGLWQLSALSSSSRASNDTRQHEHNTNTEEGTKPNENNHNENNNKKKYYTTNSTTFRKKGKRLTANGKTINKDRIQTVNSTYYSWKNLDVISLDNSDNESVISLDNENGCHDIIIIDEIRPSGNENDYSDKNTQGSVKIPQENDSNKENNEVEKVNNNNLICNESDYNDKSTQEKNDEECDANEIPQEDNESSKENNEINAEKLNFSNLDLDYLIPQNHVEIVVKENDFVTPTLDKVNVSQIETEILYYKRMITKLEEAEVTNDCEYSSPYVICARYKRKIVQLYKQLCKINGYSEDIVKRPEIRLHVAEGHPSGPAKRLEYFLNEKINRTGTVAFPDFTDVVTCVLQSNHVDRLGWERKQVFQEAAALFRQCGQALRKRRQKREYKDLLSLVQDKEQTDDPAENDPLLFAKLEKNKQIAKVKEEEILERYVNMENNVLSEVDNRQAGNPIEFNLGQDSSGSDSEIELNVELSDNLPPLNFEYDEKEAMGTYLNSKTDKTSPQNMNTGIMDFGMGEISKTIDIIKNNNVAVPPANSMPVTSTTINNQSETSEGTPGKDIFRYTPKSNTDFKTTVINNQCYSGESSKSNDIFAVGRKLNVTVTSSNLNVLPTSNVTMTTPSLISISTSKKFNSNNLPLSFNGMINNHRPVGEGSNSIDVVCHATRINQDSGISLQDNGINNENKDSRKVPAINESCNTDKNSVSCLLNEASVSNHDDVKPEDGQVKSEDIKKEPLDIQTMLDDLGDNFVCTILDIEDPFLVIEISSDGCSDDD